MKKVFSSILFSLLLGQSFFIYTLIKPIGVDRALITAASATLSNPRRSYYASVDGALTAGTSVIPIKSSGGDGPETDTQGLFPNDKVVIGPNGDEVVTSVPVYNGTNFIISGGLNVGVLDKAIVMATQSGTLTVSFTIGSTIPANGKVEVIIPDPSSNGNDGRPDYDATLANSGFDANGIGTANAATSGGTNCNWNGAEAFTAGNGSTGHIYSMVTSAACTGGTITVTIGDQTKPLVNPARVGNIGTADIYQVKINTKTGGNVVIESQDVSVALVDGVLVSANVDETLAFTVAGRAASTKSCNMTTGVTTTATTVPWGVLSTTYAEGTHNAAQQLTVSTNSSSGYKVYAQENDQMGKNGNVCTGATPSSGEYTFNSGVCIRDANVTDLTHTVQKDWGTGGSGAPGVNQFGFGYSLENVTSTPAKFTYNNSGTFMAKQFADKEASESETAADAELMTKGAGPINADSVYVCFRINIPADQPSGYYYNVLRYTAVPIF